MYTINTKSGTNVLWTFLNQKCICNFVKMYGMCTKFASNLVHMLYGWVWLKTLFGILIKRKNSRVMWKSQFFIEPTSSINHKSTPGGSRDLTLWRHIDYTPLEVCQVWCRTLNKWCHRVNFNVCSAQRYARLHPQGELKSHIGGIKSNHVSDSLQIAWGHFVYCPRVTYPRKSREKGSRWARWWCCEYILRLQTALHFIIIFWWVFVLHCERARLNIGTRC